MSDEVKQPTAAASKKATRGVSYPFIGLGEAVEKARLFHKEERKSAAPVASAMKHFGYAESSGVGRQTVSALLQFALLEDSGRKEDRQVKLTDDALTILLDLDDSPERIRALQRCVRNPKLYTSILSKWPDELPSDHTLGFYLQKEFDFNPKTLQDFISAFRSSLAFAKLTGAPTIGPKEEEKFDGDPAERPIPEVGDTIQWESGGVLRMDGPRKVRAKQEHEGSWWVFVEGSETGIPMSEAVVLERKPSEDAVVKVAPVLRIQDEIQSPERSRGEREWLRGPLSKEVNYRLIVSGELGSKEIGKLIKLLEAQKLVLDDE